MTSLFRAYGPISTDWAALILRISLGAMMLYGHGWPKFSSYAERADSFYDPFGIGSPASLALAIFAELACSVLLIAGLFTRLAILPLAITMLVAAFGANAGEPFGKKELALVYLAGFVALFLVGSGRYSADAWWERRQV